MNLLRTLPRKFLAAGLMVMLLWPNLMVALSEPTLAATSPWSQTDWSGGSGQASWSDVTQFDSSSNVTTATAGQASLTNSEKFTNTTFESDTSSWSSAPESTAGTFSDDTFANSSGAVVAWPLDDTTSTQSYARAVNPAIATGRDLVINGTFASDTSWSKGTGWTIAGGVAHADGTQNPSTTLLTSSVGPLVADRVYQATYTVSNLSAGAVNIRLGATDGTTRSANGTYTEYLVATSNTLLSIRGSGLFVGDIDNVIVTQVNIPAYNATSPTQALADGTMEAAGTSSWISAGGAATLSKQTTNPHGGSQVLRIARNTNNPSAVQNILTANTVYRATGYARSDGNAVPQVGDETYNPGRWTGSTSTAWQSFDITFVVATNSRFSLRAVTSTGTQYVEFDDVVVSVDNYIRPGELSQDGDMEAAGTSNWTATATLSKQSTSPHGGSQLLRITSASGNLYATNNVGNVGKTYRITGWARSNGSIAPVVSDSAGVTKFTGTTSTSWQFFDVATTTTTVEVAKFRTTSTGYTEWDDISITEINPLIGLNTSGVTLGSTANGHLTTGYTFDGINDVVNLHSNELNSAINGGEGTLLVWAKVASSGTWSDGSSRYIINIGDSGSNLIRLAKNAPNNTMYVDYRAGGVDLSNVAVPNSSTGWFQLAVSWSKSSDQVKAYLNGSQQGATLTGLGTWSAPLNSTATTIGAVNTSGNNAWSGMINDVRLYNRALSATEIANLYNGFSAARDTGQAHGGTASMKVITDSYSNADIIQSVNVGDTNSYNLVAYAYTTGAAVTSADAELFYNGATVSTTYTSVGSGWYKLSGTVTGANASRNYGVQVKASKTVYLDDLSLNTYPSSGTLTSSIFDNGQGTNWGTLTYNATTPVGTAVSVKMRSSNNSNMSGAAAFSSCTAITSGTDISSNNCVTDNQRYIQYQLTLTASDTTITPTFQDISLAFAISDVAAPGISLTSLSPDPSSDNTPTFSGTATEETMTVANVQFQVDSTSGSWTACTATDGSFNSASENFTCTTAALTDGSHTLYVRSTDSNGNTTSSGFTSDTFTIDTVAPLGIELVSPGDKSYTNNERPNFRWKATTDATSGINRYVLDIDAPSLGDNQPSGDFSIGDIPPSRTTDVETNKYLIHYENFGDSDDTNNYISVTTKSSSEWGSSENDGKLREGITSWTVKAVDNATNETRSSRTFFVDKSSPNVDLLQLNEVPLNSQYFATTDTTPTLFGKISDSLAGASAPNQTQTVDGPKVASGPKNVEVKIEKRSGILYSVVSIRTLNFDKSRYACDDSEVSDNTQQRCDKYVPFEFSPGEALSAGTYKITLTGRDIADNSTEKSFVLTVGNLSTIASPEEIAVIDEKVKDLPTAEQQKVREEITITKPVAPTSTDKTNEKITETRTNIFDALQRAASWLTQSFQRAAEFAWTLTRSTLAYIFDTTTQTIAVVSNSLLDVLQQTTNGISTGLAYLGNGLQQLSDSVGRNFDFLADRTPKLLRGGLISLGNTAGAVSYQIALGLNTASDALRGATQQMAANISQSGQNADATIRQNATSISLFAGRQVKGFSASLGNSIIEFAYTLIPEPTRITAVQEEILSPTSVKITWETNNPANGKVNYGYKDGDYDFDVQTDKRSTHHEFVLTNLTPGTQYHYEVMSQSGNYVYDANRKFKTPTE